jgi:hypothetical protein
MNEDKTSSHSLDKSSGTGEMRRIRDKKGKLRK